MAIGSYKDVAFADWMIESRRFYVRVPCEQVIGVTTEAGGPEADSLGEFFRLYLSEPCPYPV